MNLQTKQNYLATKHTHITMHRYKTFLFCIVYILMGFFFLTACQKNASKLTNNSISFQDFVNQVFLTEIQSDSITLNYTLEHPENYGIIDFTPTLGHYTLDAMKNNLVYMENSLSLLKSYNYSTLTSDEQLLYDLLLEHFEVDKNMDDLLLYQECLSPTTGFQAQLPVLLAEYNFYNKEDMIEYLMILPLIYDYFEEIIAFEQEKSKAGLFMSDETADAIITQCKAFIEEPQNNLLIEIFEDKLNNFTDLTEQEKKKYIKQNKNAILTKVIPAYENLIDTLTDLKGTGKNEHGLSYLPKGKKYYEYLVKSSTGSSRSIKDINSLLDKTFQNSISTMSEIASKDNSIFTKFDKMKFPITEPSAIINYLEAAIEKDFPKLNSVNCTIKYVHPSLENYLSPAFYLTPALDHFSENSIYINGNDEYDLSNIFPTVAHEGYPGHLYQSVYYNQQSPEAIRSILSYGGYSEGWATYAEVYSYELAGLDHNLATFCQNNLIATLCMYAKIDIGVNYYGWQLKDTTKYLNSCGVTNEDAIDEVHKTMIQEPSNYMKYTLGYIEFAILRKKAETELKEAFNTKEYHTFILNLGPCSFDILNSRLDNWIKEQNS